MIEELSRGVLDRQRAVEQREQRWDGRLALAQGQGRPGANGPQDHQAIAGAGNNHVVPWRQGDQPAAGMHNSPIYDIRQTQMEKVYTPQYVLSRSFKSLSLKLAWLPFTVD